ncbi:MAG: heparinase II/III family protein [Roseinatronobacter sp.]
MIRQTGPSKSGPSPSGTSQIGLLDRMRLRARVARMRPVALVNLPEPRRIGQYARGRQMLAGDFLIEGEMIRSPGQIPFAARNPEVVDALHGFGWLDHLATVGTSDARALAQAGLAEWIARFGRGEGPGWAPGLTGRRVLVWIGHALFLLQDMAPDDQDRFLRMLALQADHLRRRAGRAPAGTPLIEAQTGYLYATLMLDGLRPAARDAAHALLRSLKALIGPDGGIASRNPEDLLVLFDLAVFAEQALVEHGLDALTVTDGGLAEVLDRMAVALRLLRHADGGLARFHGGGRGDDGVLAAALAAHDLLRAPGPPRLPDQAMGVVRLAAGRCTVLIDAAAPPIATAPARAHASTLAFELTSNRRPLIVSCGDGRSYGPDWHRASRATASHSTLAFEGYSSARFATSARARLDLGEGPRQVGVEYRHAPHARIVALSHDGYVASHGVEHLRYLDLSADGRVLSGCDSLIASSKAERRRFDEVRARSGGKGAAFALRFHLHPDADPSLDLNGTAVSVALRSGEIWVFRAEGRVLALAPSVYLEKDLVKPRPSQQIVLSLRATDYTTQINWSMAKAQDTPLALRDLVEDDPMAVPQM